MTVYVDDVEHSFGNMLMCHMWADSLEELFAMADQIGVARKWLQGHPTLSIGKAKNASFLHFDVAKSKKKRAIKAGAKLTDKYGPSEWVAKQDMESGSIERMRRGMEVLARIASARARRSGPQPETLLP